MGKTKSSTLGHGHAQLSGFAKSVLRRLKGGRITRRVESGDVMQGSVRVPKSVVTLLCRQELAKVAGDRLLLTEMGERYLRRQETPRRRGDPTHHEGEVGEYRRQHMALAQVIREDSKGTLRKVLTNRAESPLGWLARRKGRDGQPMLDQAQYDAGERLREDFEQAGMGTRMTAVYEGVPVSRMSRGAMRAGNISDRRIDAGRRVALAVEAMGPGLSDIALRVCCHLEGLAIAEKGMGWPARSGKVVLALALQRLADFYEGGHLKKRAPEDAREGEGPPISS